MSPGAPGRMSAYARWKASRRRRRLERHGVRAEVEAETASYGARSGWWTVATDRLGPESVVYSFGVGDNLAWELAMIERHGVRMHAFDPTPRSIAWVAEQDLPPELSFHPIGLAAHDGELELWTPRKETSKNFSVLAPRRGGPTERVRCPVARLATHAERLGHGRIDVLKLDIEGAERDAVPELLGTGPPIGQLLLELHYGHPAVELDDALALIATIRGHGFRLLDVSPRGYELTFLHPSWLSGTSQRPPR